MSRLGKSSLSKVLYAESEWLWWGLELWWGEDRKYSEKVDGCKMVNWTWRQNDAMVKWRSFVMDRNACEKMLYPLLECREKLKIWISVFSILTLYFYSIKEILFALAAFVIIWLCQISYNKIAFNSLEKAYANYLDPRYYRFRRIRRKFP